MGMTEFYNHVIEETTDARTKNWFLVHSPIPIALILSSYCYFVFVCGPKFMQNREAYSFKTFIKYYNIFQIISNAIAVYVTATSGWTTTFGWGCQPLDTSATGEGYRMAVIVWWVYMLKLIDLSETMLHVLRKKHRQISFLHVYHHITTALIAWICAKWNPGGMLSSIMLINCAVHVVMYTYYLMSTGGPMLETFLKTIKPSITIIQMVQFCILLVHVSIGLSPSCDVPTAAHALVALDILINFYLFLDFYKKTYLAKKVA